MRLLVAALAATFPLQGHGAALILNEYNAVAGSEYLNGGGAEQDESGGTVSEGTAASDSRLGRVLGNGSLSGLAGGSNDWFELVVTLGNLDIRGWQLEIADGGDSETLVLSQADVWSALRAGTIITVAESPELPDDVGYDPGTGDWTIHVRAADDGTGEFITASNFVVNNDDWTLTIRNARGERVFGPAGEGPTPGVGVNDREIFALQGDPGPAIEEDSTLYRDGVESTFGEPNTWGSGAFFQDFDALRAGEAPEDPTDAIFDADRLLNVSILMDPADFEALRNQSRSPADTIVCEEVPQPSPFPFFLADVVIDGTTIEGVGVRKKGFLGSLSATRPSFKVKFDEYVPGQLFEGIDRLTLNNNLQDPAQIKQCIGYQMLREAGVPASRCNMARVSVNGEDLGIYANVESIKEAFLQRSFGSSNGSLYEGTISDLRAGFFGTFQFKNDEDGIDLLTVAHLLEAPDEALLAELDDLVDVEAFLTFWAMEGLIGHWDGYNGNNNNFWLYNDPATGFRFIPWGIDATFAGGNQLDQLAGQPVREVAPSVNLNAQLSWRLYQIPEMKQRFLDRLFLLRGFFFPEGATPEIVSALDAWEAQINPAGPGFSQTLADDIDGVRQWLLGRRGHIDDEFADGDPTPPAGLGPRFCLEPAGSVAFDFAADVSLDPLAEPPIAPAANFDLVLFDEPISVLLQGTTVALASVALPDPEAVSLTQIAVTPQILVFLFSLTQSQLVSGPGFIEIPDSFFNLAIRLPDPGEPDNFQAIGPMTDILIRFDEATPVVGEPVSGRAMANLTAFGLAPANPLPPLPVPEPGLALLQLAAFAAMSALRRGGAR